MRGLSALVTLAATAVAIAVAAAVATIIIVTPIGAGGDAVSAQVSREGVFSKSAGVHDPYDKVSAPVRVYNRLIQVAGSAGVLAPLFVCRVWSRARSGRQNSSRNIALWISVLGDLSQVP